MSTYLTMTVEPLLTCSIAEKYFKKDSADGLSLVNALYEPVLKLCFNQNTQMSMNTFLLSFPILKTESFNALICPSLENKTKTVENEIQLHFKKSYKIEFLFMNGRYENILRILLNFHVYNANFQGGLNH